MTPWLYDLFMIFIAGLLVLINGFFVGAEFALVKIRESRVEEMVKERRPFASTASWLIERLDASLEVLEVMGPRVVRIRLTLSELPPDQRK